MIKNFIGLIPTFSLLLLGLIPASSYMEIVTHDLFGYLYISDAWNQGYRYAAGEVAQTYTQITGLIQFTRPPLYPALLWLTSHLLGRNLFAFSLITFIPRTLLPLVTYLWLSKLTNKIIAFAASSFTVFLVSYQTYSLASFESDALTAVLIVLAFTCLLIYRQKPTLYKSILLGLTAGFLSITKEIGLLITLLAIANGFMFNKKKYWKLTAVSLLITLFLFSIYIWLAWPTSFTLYASRQYGMSASTAEIFKNFTQFIKIIFERYLVLNWIELRPTLISSFKLLLIGFGIIQAFRRHLWSIPTILILGILSFSTINPRAIAGGVESLRHMNFTVPLIISLYALGIDWISKLNKSAAYLILGLLTIKAINEHVILHAKMGPPQYYLNIFTLYKHPKQLPLIPVSGSYPVASAKREDLIAPRVSLNQYYSIFQSAEDVYTPFYLNSIRIIFIIGLIGLIIANKQSFNFRQ